MKLKLEELYDQLADKLNSQKDSDVCLEYGEKMRSIYKDYKAGNNRVEAHSFMINWLPWAIGKKMVSFDQLKSLSQLDRKKINVVIGEKSKTIVLKSGSWVIIDSNVRLTKSARGFSYGNSHVTMFDESVVHSYGTSNVTAKSGWVYAYENSKIDFRGRGIVEAYDTTFLTVRGDVMVFTFDQCIMTANLQVHHLEKRVDRFRQFHVN